MRLLYTIAKEKGRYFANNIKDKVYLSLSKESQALRASKNRLVELEVYPILKRAIVDNNITCEGCFYWENDAGRFRFPQDAQASREFPDLLINATATDYKMLWDLAEAVKAIAKANLNFIGSLITNYLRSNSQVRAPRDYLRFCFKG